jgi:hypothetical protein
VNQVVRVSAIIAHNPEKYVLKKNSPFTSLHFTHLFVLLCTSHTSAQFLWSGVGFALGIYGWSS